MRSFLRWLGRLVLGAVLVAVLVAALALVTVHTGWGREQLRRRAEAALRAAFPGGARVGAIEGSILGALTVRDVELDGRDHRPLVTIGTLHVTVALWPLAVQTAQVEQLVADDVRVFVHREPPPVAAEPPPASGSLPWRVELLHVEIHRAAIDLEAAGTTQTLTGVDVAGAATIGAAGVSMFGWSHATWSQRSAELTATVAVELDGGLHVPAALISVGAAAQRARERDPTPTRGAVAVIGATALAIDVDHPRGAIAVSAPASVVATLLPGLDLHGIVADPHADVVATIEATAAPATTQVEIAATAGETRLWASLHGEPATRTGQGVIGVTAVDLGRVTRGRLDGRDDVLAALDFGPDQLRGTVIAGDGSFARWARDAIAATAALGRTRALLTSQALGRHGEALQATHDLETALGLGPRGAAAPQLFATGLVRRDGATILLEDAHAVASAQAVAFRRSAGRRQARGRRERSRLAGPGARGQGDRVCARGTAHACRTRGNRGSRHRRGS